MASLTNTPQQSLSQELRALINQKNILTARSKAKVLVALDKEIEASKTRQRFDLRSKVIDEIFTSEVSYLNQLEIILKYFKEPLESSGMISPANKRCLFGNIESIYQVNGELVNQLKIKGNNVAAAFLYLAPFFKVYSMYAYNYKNALTLLEELTKNSSQLREWVRNQESRPEVMSKLCALLITPIQRLPRYRLLLRQLLSLTPTTHQHHSILIEAVKEVEKATAHIDSLVFEQETHSRLITLQQCLLNSKPSIIEPNKRLLKEGVLMKMSANGQKAQKRYFILLTDSILYCKLLCKDRDLPPSGPGSLQCCCVLPISKCSVESVLGQGVFNLSCRSETYILFSEHRDNAMEWSTAIRDAVFQYQENLKTLRKKSSSRHTLHLTRKRKFFKENEPHGKENHPTKKARLDHITNQGGSQISELQNGPGENVLQDKVQRTNYFQSIKSMFQTFGESLRQYMYPGRLST